jgi:NADPH:quinone reductase-like Zn-dependent oxidoreductase
VKLIVVTDQAAGTAGMKLAERPEPSAAIDDVIVQIHASGFVPTEMAWPSTWTDRRDRDRTPSIPLVQCRQAAWSRTLLPLFTAGCDD